MGLTARTRTSDLHAPRALSLPRVAGDAAAPLRSSQDLETVVLRHQLTVLRRQIARPTLNDADRALPGAIAAALPRARRAGWLSPPTRCCAGTANASPATGPAHTDRPDGPPSPPASAPWPYGWHARTPPGATGASTVNSSGVATGVTTNPTAAWTVQAASNLFLVHGDRLADAKALAGDRGSQFTASFDNDNVIRFPRCGGLINE